MCHMCHMCHTCPNISPGALLLKIMMRSIVARNAQYTKASGAARTAADYPEIFMVTSPLMWFPEVCLHRIVRTGFLST